jgi:sporulation protein YqfC
MKQKCKKHGTGVLKRFAHCIDLPDFAAGLDECIEVWGGNTVQVEGAKGIHTYEKEVVKIHMKNYLLVLRGDAFELKHFTDGCLRISGRLQSVSWEAE